MAIDDQPMFAYLFLNIVLLIVVILTINYLIDKPSSEEVVEEEPKVGYKKDKDTSKAIFKVAAIFAFLLISIYSIYMLIPHLEE